MTKTNLIEDVLANDLNDIYDLLALRLLFAPQEWTMDIEQDIRDLYVYPERLDSSYRDEWRRIAKRALFREGFPDHWLDDRENLSRYVRFLQKEAIPRCIHNHIELFRMLGEVLNIQRCSRTVVLPNPRRRALDALIWPELAR